MKERVRLKPWEGEKSWRRIFHRVPRRIFHSVGEDERMREKMAEKGQVRPSSEYANQEDCLLSGSSSCNHEYNIILSTFRDNHTNAGRGEEKTRRKEREEEEEREEQGTGREANGLAFNFVRNDLI